MADLIEVDDPRDPRLVDYTDLTDVSLRRVREPAEGLFLAEGEKVDPPCPRRRATRHGPCSWPAAGGTACATSVAAYDCPVYLADDALLRADHRLPRAPRRAGVDAASSAARPRRRARHRTPRGGARGPGRPHQRGRGLPQRCGARHGRSAREPRVRRPALPPQREGLDGLCVRRAVDPGRPVARHARPAGRARLLDAGALARPVGLPRTCARSRSRSGGGRSAPRATGSPTAALAACQARVRIPMAAGVDSLNVAAASAVTFYALGQA